MNWQAFLSTPPPQTVWSLDRKIIAVAHRDRKSGDRCGAIDTPAGSFDLGPTGLGHVDVARLKEALSVVHSKIEGTRRAGVVIPTHWVRCFLLEAEDIPRRQSDMLEVLRWRFKKLLPVAPAELRIVVATQDSADSGRHILCVAVSEKAMAQLEEAFEGAGIVPGLILPRIFALALSPASDIRQRLIIQQESSTLAMMVIDAGGVRLVRTKPLPEDGVSWEALEREFKLALHFIREFVVPEGEVSVTVSASDETQRRSMFEWFGSQEKLVVSELDGNNVCPDLGLAATLGPARLALLKSVLDGGTP